MLSPASFTPASGGEPPMAGAGRHKVTAKALRKALKKAGLKTTGKKAALTRRAKKAHLKMRGGGEKEDTASALTKAVKEGGDVEAAKAAAAAAGWTDAEIADVIAKASPGMTAGRSRRRRNGLVQGVYRGTTGLAKGSLRQVGRLGRAVFGRGGKGGGDKEDM